MSIYFNDKRYPETKFDLENDFEKKILENHKLLFGENTILINTKKKIDSGDLGKAIPDGFLFDFSDPDDPRFYLIEVELQSHDFYRHIFPQITKFFGFVRGNTSDQSKLIDALYRIIESDDSYKKQFKNFLKERELFKFLKDLIESSGDILLIIDGKKPEIDEIKITYSDTWGKYVKLVVARVFECQNQSIIYCDPDFEIVEAVADDEIEDDDSGNDQSAYSENYHLADCTDDVKNIYKKLKDEFPDVTFNSQRYYISMKTNSNFCYLIVRKKLIRAVVLMPENEVKKTVHHYSFKEPGEGVQRFYNAKCTDIKIDSPDHLPEVIELLRRARTFDKLRIR